MWRADSNAPANRCNDSTVSVLRSASRRNSSMIAPVSAQDRTHRLPSATCSGVQLDSGFGSLIESNSRVLMREIQALDPTVDPDQAIRTLCAPAAPAVPKAPAALATPAAAQALKLTDVAARLGAGPMRRSYRTQPSHTPIPGVAPRAGMPCPVGAPTRIVDGFVSAR